jgi:uncharacterized LabA/DUF88 family protein
MLENFNFGRFGIFIDEANIYHSQKTLGWKVDYLKLKKYFANLAQISILNFYTSFLEENVNQFQRFQILSDNNFNVVKKNLKFIKSKNGPFIKKGNLDIELALDAYRQKDEYETFVLFSGDSDFEYLLKLLKENKKRTIVISTRKHISKELLAKADYYLDLKKVTEEISF